MISKFKYKQYEKSPVNKLPRRSKHRIVKRIKKGNCSGAIINYILGARLDDEINNGRRNTSSSSDSDLDVDDDRCDPSPDLNCVEIDLEEEDSTSNLTKDEKVLLIAAFVIKHGLTKEATNDCLILMRLLCPDDMDLPGSHFLLMNKFRANQ
ncbi:unnamed protein product, partial [Allacma fusca]